MGGSEFHVRFAYSFGHSSTSTLALVYTPVRIADALVMLLAHLASDAELDAAYQDDITIEQSR